MNGRNVPLILAGVIVAAIATFVVADLVGGSGSLADARWASAVAMLCVAIWIGPGMLRRYSGNGSAALKAVALWLVIACAAALVFVYGRDYFPA